jgi:hypothetical protein
MALLFGTEDQNEGAITVRAREMGDVRGEIADFIDSLPPDQFDRDRFQATRRMPAETRQKLDALLYRYQQEKGALELAKKRLSLVRSAGRSAPSTPVPEVDADLLVGQMFGALDRIRLQMSMDLLYLEHLLQATRRARALGRSSPPSRTWSSCKARWRDRAPSSEACSTGCRTRARGGSRLP